MSRLLRHFCQKFVSSSGVNRFFISTRRLSILSHFSLNSSPAAMNTTSSRSTNDATSGLKENDVRSFHLPEENYNCITEDKFDYESAVLKLQSLVSNADVLASMRETTREYRHKTHIPNMNKLISQSGITEEEIDRMSMIHVSGTKGKGSTCAFCERLLNSKGYKTGLFTSPHLVEVRERIRINGRPVSKEMYAYHFWKVYNKMKAAQQGTDDKFPAYFAFNVIISLHIFLSEGVDVSIIEVGIGGQYDSTNFIRTPTVCGMTSLGYDHTSILGNTIEQIAWNKAGIFKPGSPAIVVKQPPSAMEVILDRAKERQSALYVSTPIEKDILAKENINLGIAGVKQAENAGLAVQLAYMWEARHKASREPVSCNVSNSSSVEEIPVLEVTHVDDVIAKGLSSVVWPGRAQTITRPGMPVTYYLDGAHTKASVEVCCHWFKEKADQEMKSLKGKVVRVMIFNVTGERKAGPLLEILKGCNFDAAVFCTNTVSTVEYSCKDQINPKYSSKVMLDKVEENRLSWDQLHNHCSLKHDLDDERTAQTTRSDEVTFKKRIIDKNSLSGSHHISSHSNPVALPSASPSTSSSSSSQNAFGLPNSPVHFADKCFSRNYVSPSNSNNHETNERISNVMNGDHDGIITKHNNNEKDNVNNNNNKNNNNNIIKNYQVKHSTIKDSQLVEDAEKSATTSHCFYNSSLSSSSSSSPPSQSFPCVLQGLLWATQGKDHTLFIKDWNIDLPPTPPVLADADHIQVLVTGSLLLVGGVLGVIDPDMNN